MPVAEGAVERPGHAQQGGAELAEAQDGGHQGHAGGDARKRGGTEPHGVFIGTPATNLSPFFSSFVAQLCGRLLGRDDVEVHPGAELEPGEVGEARHDVDPPAEVVGAARRGAHPQVQRRRGAEAAPQAPQRVVQQRRRRSARRPRSAPAAAAARA